MSTALINGRVLTDEGFVTDHALLIEGARISGIVDKHDHRLKQSAVHDLRGQTVVPGFIDWQANGGGGVLFNDDPSVETIRRIATAHRRFGTTGLLPTLISTDLDVMRAALDAVREAIVTGEPGILGIHLEGPLLSPARPGVHEVTRLRDIDAQLLDLVCSLGVGRTVMTIAPERVPMAVIEKLTERGVILSAGHTAADYLTARAAFDAGVRGVTHLFNAMSPMQSRDPGMVGAALEDSRSWCGLVVDGHHVHPATLRVAIAAKRRGRMSLVTDAMPLVGTSDSSFRLGTKLVTCVDGRCQTDSGVLAGSALDMASAVRNTVGLIGLTLEEAARMASTYSAEFLGLSNDRGRLAAGQRADLVVLDDDLHAQEVWIGGTLQR